MTVSITPQGTLGRIADALMTPLMYMLQGTLSESPQRTHVWNNVKLSRHQLRLDDEGLVHCAGDPDAAKPRWYGIPRFHMPICGGWRRFVVVEAMTSNPWHVGWITSHGFVGVSRIPLHGPVRLTIGPGESTFFALKADGTQFRLKQIGEGFIGNAGEFRHVPLL